MASLQCNIRSIIKKQVIYFTSLRPAPYLRHVGRVVAVGIWIQVTSWRSRPHKALSACKKWSQGGDGVPTSVVMIVAEKKREVPPRLLISEWQTTCCRESPIHLILGNPTAGSRNQDRANKCLMLGFCSCKPSTGTTYHTYACQMGSKWGRCGKHSRKFCELTKTPFHHLVLPLPPCLHLILFLPYKQML